MTLTLQERVAELRRLEADATPSPWSFVTNSVFVGVEYRDGKWREKDNCECLGSLGTKDDSAFIAAARNHLPAILDALEKSERRRDFTEQWYAERLEPIKDVAKRVGVWPEVAAIIANGSCSPHTPPTYAQQLNIAKFKAEDATARADALAARVAELEEGLRPLAEAAESLDEDHEDDVTIWETGAATCIDGGDLRRAAALLADTKGGQHAD